MGKQRNCDFVPTLWKAYCSPILHPGKKWKKMLEKAAVEQQGHGEHLQTSPLPPFALATRFLTPAKALGCMELSHFHQPLFQKEWELGLSFQTTTSCGHVPRHTAAFSSYTPGGDRAEESLVEDRNAPRLRTLYNGTRCNKFLQRLSPSPYTHTNTSGMLHNPCLSSPLWKEVFLEYFNDSLL